MLFVRDPEEDRVSRSKQLVRRAHALLILVGECFKQAHESFTTHGSGDGDKVMTAIVSKLLQIYSLSPTGRVESDSALTGLRCAARACLEETLRKMAVSSFAQAILHMLRSGDDQVCRTYRVVRVTLTDYQFLTVGQTRGARPFQRSAASCY
jgi:hypothetical protein